jgi:uncharacterized protein YbjT (DUF2867 family)
MIASKGVALVIGEAGGLAGSVAGRLCDYGLAVRILPDEPTSHATQALEARGVELLPGSLDDPTSLKRAFSGVEALFLVLDQTDVGPSGRRRRGSAIGDAAKQAGVRHVVYSAGAGPDHHLTACDQSKLIEDHLRSIGLPLTVLRPVTIMEEIPWFWLSLLGSEAVLATPYGPTTKVAMICLDDVAALAARAMAEPAPFEGQTIEIAGDEVSMAEVADLLRQELGRHVQATEVQVEGVFMLAEADQPGIDIPRIRSLYPQLHTVSTWLASGGGLELCRAALAPQSVQPSAGRSS